MDASDTTPAETGSDGPAAAKRPKLESTADDDEDISIIEEHINVRLPQANDAGSPTAQSSPLSNDDAGEDSQDSKIAEFRNKMLKFEAEASHLRTQLKREREKAESAEREKVKAEGVKHYLEQKYEEERKRANEAEAVARQKTAEAEKKAKDLQKQCDRLTTRVQCKEAEIEYRDKHLGNAAKDLNEAKKKAEDAEKEAAEATKKATHAEQLATDANARTVEADTKKAAAEKEASDLKEKLEKLEKRKAEAKRKMKTKIAELENRLTNRGASGQPSSSTDEKPPEGLSELNKRIAQKDEEITKLRMDVDKLKKDLSASRAKATRLENARKKTVDDYSEKDDEIRTLKEQIDDLRFEKDEEIRRLGVKIEELQKLAFRAILFDARLETARLRQAVGRFDGISDKIMMKCDHRGVWIKNNPSRPTLPKVLLELKPSFFAKFDCSEECLVQTDYSLLLKGFASQTEKEQCLMQMRYNCAMGIYFKRAGANFYDPALLLDPWGVPKWTLIEDNAAYVCTFEMNSFVLAQAAQKLSPVLLDFSNHGQPAAVSITDSEERLCGDQREYLWRSLPGDNPHANDFKADPTRAAPGTHLRIYVDSKYLRRCVMASSGAGSKTVEVAMSDATLRVRYGNEHFSLTYYIPTVKPTENGERCYSPIEFGTEIFEI
ncbi:hypothetical protein AAVH_09039 [Aphelenchoides avenae]|nr:hypothetical protein AAVH_09039 [Aphelenchus avenae]